ncbi:LuxR C-terminal-related transcriptional regulator [Streptomyces sp. NPDC021098]|uniref:helix-turn-helix transcriptional regulator n=1 Tax=unclassified Streptomyces TaxID=2593676 RepID=UPI0037A3BE99
MPTHVTSPPIEVAVQAADPVSRAGAVELIRHQPDVEVNPRGDASVTVLLVESVDEETLGTLRRLVRSGTRVVLVAHALREAEMLTVVECGVSAVLWRHEATGERLSRVARSAHRGDGDLPPDLVGRLLERLGQLQRSASQGTAAPATGLTAREVDVLRLVAEGLETREIATKMAYSERTVKSVLHDMMTRQLLRNRAHAVAYALREGYI